MKRYTSQWETLYMRLPLPFTTNLDLYGNPRACVITQIARGDKPQDIRHLQGGILLCRHVRAQGYNSYCFPSPGRRVRKGGRSLKPPSLLLCFPQNSCQQTDLTPWKVCHQHSRPLEHSGWAGSITPAVTCLTLSGCLPWGWFAERALKYLGGLYPKVVVSSQDMSDSRAGLHLLVKRPPGFCLIVEISLLHNFWIFEFFYDHIFLEELVGKMFFVMSMRQNLGSIFYEICESIIVIQLCLLLLMYWWFNFAKIIYIQLPIYRAQGMQPWNKS